MNRVDYVDKPLSEIYGENCFSDSVMREKLPRSVFDSFQEVKNGAAEMSLEIAEVIAEAMKSWAISKGATHYTHWFQPLTGLTAEKHDSFISPSSNFDGSVIIEFSGKELIQGEPDASSFPSGGLRATFEARGYTAWDTTSPAFLKKDGDMLTLTIPTAFVSYTGEALDKKVPVLRSMEALSREAARVCHLMGHEDVKRCIAFIGPEQEYFLVDRDLYNGRPDLRLTGRTVFGTMAAKGQELDDHYFGAMKDRVADYMKTLNFELWKLGISAKTQHNEVAPHQFEIATVFDTANVATDRNQLVMETIKKVAERKNLVALLHEKPFAGVNGSGKHNNWSVNTDTGINLMEPGDSPEDNAMFLVFLSAVIKAIDTYASLIRMSASNAGNDHRLGANEAPPAIVSIFLGDQLSVVYKKLAKGEPIKSADGELMEIGTTSLPKFPKDIADRNRTSPVAFTGNKFEFRMMGSSQSLAGPNVVINTAVAEILAQFAVELENSSDINAAVKKIVTDTYREHGRVIYNGNGYSEEWVQDARKRGLPNLANTVASLPEITKKYSVELFGKHGVLSREELESRFEIYLENYSKEINIEAGVMLEMVRKDIYPACNSYITEIAQGISSVLAAGGKALPVQTALLESISSLQEDLLTASDKLEKEVTEALSMDGDSLKQAQTFSNRIVPAMAEVRVAGDALERLTDRKHWPYPSYEDLLFRL